jgi:hypothetical protein
MPLSSLIAIANFKQFLILSKIFQITHLHEVGSYPSFLKLLFWWEFVLRNRDCKKNGQQEQE